MTEQSPLQFARQFEKLKSDINRQNVSDLKILSLIDFWPYLADVFDKAAYNSYIEEFSSLLLNLISTKNLSDFKIDEKQNLLDIVTKLTKGKNRKTKKTKREIVIQSLIRDYFFVGDIENSLKIIGDNYKIQIPLEVTENLNDLDEYEAFNIIYDRSIKLSPSLHKILLPIKIEWESIRESVEHEGVFCLFVEKDGNGKISRGRMRILQSNIELFGETATTDEITFDNQIKTPDDPFIGVAYDALEAVRKSFRLYSSRELAKRYYHARYSIKDSSQSFAGDSIGLAFGLTAYTGLLKNEIHRQKQFVASDVAFTGSLNSNGDIIGVNKETLFLKIERAFYSPVKYLVIPESNMQDAVEILKKLNIHHKRRNLKLISVSRLKDCIENRNIIREEKVCLGEYIGGKTIDLIRRRIVQIPALIVLLAIAFLLYAQQFPKHMPWFDRNPEFVTLTKNCFKILNQDSVFLWSKQYDCDSIEPRSTHLVSDLDDDGLNEVAICPKSYTFWENNVDLFVYSYKGNELFRRKCSIYGKFPGDSSHLLQYKPFEIDFLKTERGNLLISKVGLDYQARTHIKIWNATGDSLGWYITNGFSPNKMVKCFSGDENECYVLRGINNDMFKSGAICLLNLDSSYGVSPPYENLKNIIPGNQKHYMVFPPSDVHEKLETFYNSIDRIECVSNDEIIVYVTAVRNPKCDLSYYLNNKLRVVDVKADDNFIPIRKELISKGVLMDVDSSLYLKRLQNEVLYWTDSGWVTEGQLRATEIIE